MHAWHWKEVLQRNMLIQLHHCLVPICALLPLAAAGSYIGVDHQAFAAGPKFRGVKMLPPGPHFFSCRPVGGSGDVAPTTGFFVHLAAKQVSRMLHS